MTHLARSLKTLAVDYTLAVMVTNNTILGDRPALGRAWSHVASCRVDVRKDGEEGGMSAVDGLLVMKRVAVLTKSTRQVSHSS